MIYVDGNDENGQSAHDVARDAERVLIDSIGVERLLSIKIGLALDAVQMTHLLVVFSSLFLKNRRSAKLLMIFQITIRLIIRSDLSISSH